MNEVKFLMEFWNKTEIYWCLSEIHFLDNFIKFLIPILHISTCEATSKRGSSSSKSMSSPKISKY